MALRISGEGILTAKHDGVPCSPYVRIASVAPLMQAGKDWRLGIRLEVFASKDDRNADDPQTSRMPVVHWTRSTPPEFDEPDEEFYDALLNDLAVIVPWEDHEAVTGHTLRGLESRQGLLRYADNGFVLFNELRSLAYGYLNEFIPLWLEHGGQWPQELKVEAV